MPVSLALGAVSVKLSFSWAMRKLISWKSSMIFEKIRQNLLCLLELTWDRSQLNEYGNGSVR